MLTRYKRGTTAQNNALTLPGGRVTVDTEKKALRLHDGATPGGFEIVGTRAYIPVPGPDTLQAGNSDIGFYGEFDDSQFFYGYVLSNKVGLSAGSEAANRTKWLKFAYYGKTLFIPRYTLRRSLHWEDIYNAGLVYGVDGEGSFPTDTPTNQLTTVTLEGNTFIVRLMTGADTDPASEGGGEWDDLFYRVWENDPTGSGWGVNYTALELGVGNNMTWVQESAIGDTTAKVRRGRTELS